MNVARVHTFRESAEFPGKSEMASHSATINRFAEQSHQTEYIQLTQSHSPRNSWMSGTTHSSDSVHRYIVSASTSPNHTCSWGVKLSPVNSSMATSPPPFKLSECTMGTGVTGALISQKVHVHRAANKRIEQISTFINKRCIRRRLENQYAITQSEPNGGEKGVRGGGGRRKEMYVVNGRIMRIAVLNYSESVISQVLNS